ncbi:MAG: DUF4339 domain-containing protein, partial [Acidimicrobiales bacterium]|nr:DUF4339 domain-containing protein [Acidimicrobiales bacterium]
MGMAMANQMANQMGGMGQPQQQAAPPPLPSAQTFHVEMNGQAQGPFTVAQIQSGVANGQVTPESLVWTAGMAEWQKAGTVEALKPLFAAPPPLPPAPGGDVPPPPPPPPPAPAAPSAGTEAPPAQ